MSVVHWEYASRALRFDMKSYIAEEAGASVKIWGSKYSFDMGLSVRLDISDIWI
jgi:hypothetical protein